MSAPWPRLVAKWNAYWFRPAPVLDLAVCRVIVVAFEVFVLFFPFAVLTIPPLSLFAEFVAKPAEQYHPLPILRLLTLPLGLHYRPTIEDLEWAYRLAQIAGILALIGLRTRTSLAAFAILRTFIVAHGFSYGEFHHIETIPTIFLWLLPFSPCGRALSIDAWLARRKSGAPPLPFDEQALWPLLVMRWVFAMVYLSAAACKLLGGGLEWLNGTTLQYYILTNSMYWGRDIGIWLGHQFGLVKALGFATVAFEATFFLVLWRPKWIWVYLPLGVMLHAGIWFAIKAPFLIWVTCYSVFVPWSAVFARLAPSSPRAGAASREITG